MTNNVSDALPAIRGRPHWTVRLLPPSSERRFALPSDCFAAISKSHVELRGWDYPHIQDESDSRHGLSYPIVDGWELFVDFMSHHEVWRFTRAGQFIHYFSFWEDEEWTSPTTTFLSIESTIATLTEIIEFASRLTGLADYTPSVDIEITLVGMAGRSLVAGPRRVLRREYVCREPEIPLTLAVPTSNIAASRHQIARDFAREVFDLFTFRVDESILHDIQRNILERRMSY